MLIIETVPFTSSRISRLLLCHTTCMYILLFRTRFRLHSQFLARLNSNFLPVVTRDRAKRNGTFAGVLLQTNIFLLAYVPYAVRVFHEPKHEMSLTRTHRPARTRLDRSKLAVPGHTTRESAKRSLLLRRYCHKECVIVHFLHLK